MMRDSLYFSQYVLSLLNSLFGESSKWHVVLVKSEVTATHSRLQNSKIGLKAKYDKLQLVLNTFLWLNKRKPRKKRFRIDVCFLEVQGKTKTNRQTNKRTKKGVLASTISKHMPYQN